MGKEADTLEASPTEDADPSMLPLPSPLKKARKVKGSSSVYDMYRKMLPPTTTWDRKARYLAIGKDPAQAGFDDIFVVSSLNHHVCILRTRVPTLLLETLDGKHVDGGWPRMTTWRSPWYDLFLPAERIAAMRIIWGMMAYLMRKIEEPSLKTGDGNAGLEGRMIVD